MPTLFISYKRDDKIAVHAIVKQLRARYFEIWIDSESIAGSADWRAEIRRGIDKSDVVLLMLTPDACASLQVKEEIDYAKSIGRRILPLQIKRVTEADQNKLGVAHLNYVNFVDNEHEGWEKLLSRDTLPPVLERDRRTLDPVFNKLHTDYLRSLFARLGRVNLAYLLDAAPRESVTLMDVYVPLFLGSRIYCDVKDGRLKDWWIQTDRNEENWVDDRVSSVMRLKQFPHMRVNQMSLDALIARVQDFIEKEAVPDGIAYLWRLESEEAAALAPYLVITGDPGSGKTTLMANLALCMAGDMLHEGDESNADLNRLGFWPLPAYTPVFVELRALIRTAFPDPNDPATVERFLNYLDGEYLKPHGLSAYLSDLRDQMRDGDVMFFLDGLDEVPDADKKARREQIKALAHLLRSQFPKCRILITSRPYAYAGDWQLEGFGQVTLSPLDPDRLEELALRLFGVVLGYEGAEEQAPQFKTALEVVPEELSRSPLFFTLMAAIWLNGSLKPIEERLPVHKGDIYRECVEVLIKRWTRKDLGGESIVDQIGLNVKQLRSVLERLAFAVHSEHGDRDDAVFDGGQIFNAVRSLGVRGVDFDSLIEVLSQRAGVIYEKAPNQFQFAHRSFQEHLSACYLTDGDRFPAQFVTDLRTNPALWWNVGELLPDEAIRQKADLWKLVKALLPHKDAILPVDGIDPIWNCIAYAGQLMVEHLATDDDRQELYRPRLRHLLVELIACGALSPIARARAGSSLSELGDPRPGAIDLDFGPDYWCEVPDEGEVTLGTDQDSDNPIHQVRLSTFYIAKYPVTYRQFQMFLDAEDGYDNPTWWKDLHLEGRTQQQKDAGEQQFKYANHPRETVSWYDAMAFCGWLSTKIGYSVALPTEDQWEKAARGTDGRIFPYGDEFDASKGNSGETGIGQTSAVGLFLDGASPYGVLDMSGNVWEWCLDEYQSESESLLGELDQAHGLRGVCWLFNAQRAAYGDRLDPDGRRDYLGFRLVCLIPVSQVSVSGH